MTEPTTEQQREICKELARAMGYSVKIVGGSFNTHFALFDATGNAEGIDGRWRETEVEAWQDAPDYFNSADASRALLVWLAADDARWDKFDLQMLALLPVQPIAQAETDEEAQVLVRKFLMTAPLPVIATAAHAAITEAK